uniref:Odorant-binding protein 18 n=1 Tax=Yemma signatus TaxID=300820 RepID=A0A3G2GRS6_9HEMI|nr:odorant-binding protein 18 [Yemma signatus]
MGRYAYCALALVLCAGISVAIDSEFYSHLEAELRGDWLAEAGRARRFRRDDSGEEHQHGGLFQGKGGWWRKNCCGDRKTINHKAMRDNREDIDSCFKETFDKSLRTIGDPFVDMYSCEGIKQMKHHHICATECAMKKLGTIDADGKVNIEKSKEHYGKLITHDQIKQITYAAIEKCAEAKELEIKDDTPDSKCNPAAINFKHCMWREILLGCPDEQLIKNSFCESVLAHIKNKDNKSEEKKSDSS